MRNETEGSGLSATQLEILRRWYDGRAERMVKLRRQGDIHRRALIVDVRARAAWAKFAGPNDRIDYEKFEAILFELMCQGVVQW